MIVTAWILFVPFTYFALDLLIVHLFHEGNMTIPNFRNMLFSIIVSAISAGVIWGGLFQ